MKSKSSVGRWTKLRRCLAIGPVFAGVAVLLIAGEAFGQSSRRRIPDCTSPDADIRIIQSPTKVPIGGRRIVTTTLLCNVGSLFFGSPEAIEVRLVDGDDLSISPLPAANRLGFLLASPEVVPDLPEPHPSFNVTLTNLFCPERDPVIYGEFIVRGLSGHSSFEGPPPTCVDPIVPTQADSRGRAFRLILHWTTLGELMSSYKW